MKIIRISAVWCPSCLVMKPRFAEVEKKYSNLDFISLDIDFDEEVASYNPGNILPVFILYNNDEEVARLVGEHKTEELSKLIEEHLDMGE
jgi:thiol-disulfide isomerase/thioredoxin